MRRAGKGERSRGPAASSGHAALWSSVIAWLSPALSSPRRRRRCPDLGGRALASEEGTLGAASQVASPWQKLGTAPLSVRQTLGGAEVVPDFDSRSSSEALTACGQDMWSPLHSREPGSREVPQTCPRAHDSQAPGLFPCSCCPLRPRGQRPGGTYQVPGGSHQLVSEEREGLIAQVCIEHVLENGPAASENKVGRSVGQQTPAQPSWVRGPGWRASGDTAVSRTRPCPHRADRQQTCY